MHLRRAAAFILGAWIIGSLFMAYIDALGPQSVETIMSRSPREIQKSIQSLGPEQVQTLFRYHSAEQDRELKRAWGFAQLVIGIALALLLVYATQVNRLAIGLCGAMLVMAVFGYFVLAPEITFLGRQLDFASGWSANRARYLALRATFLIVEALKLGLGCVLTTYLFVFRTPRTRRRTDSESVEATVEAQRNPA